MFGDGVLILAIHLLLCYGHAFLMPMGGFQAWQDAERSHRFKRVEVQSFARSKKTLDDKANGIARGGRIGNGFGQRDFHGEESTRQAADPTKEDALRELEAMLRTARTVLAPGDSPRSTPYGTLYYVREFLSYKERQRRDLYGRIVAEYGVRAENTPNLAGTKSGNPLVTLPGTPGSGKSAFFAHFPSSEEYQGYAAKHGKGQQPTVCTLTFNAKMGTIKQDVLGLRVIFGALASMGYGNEQAKELDWKAFFNKYQSLNGMTALEAVLLLRQEAVGISRRVLIQVDEVAQANDPREVCRQLGEVLNEDGQTDVLVSALTPKYISDLVTPTQRTVKYFPVPPLPADLTWDEYQREVQPLVDAASKAFCKAWAMKKADSAEVKSEKKMTLEEFKVKCRILLAAPLFACGHPRTIEHLVREKKWIVLLNYLKDPTCTAGDFMREVSNLDNFAEFFGDAVIEEELDYLLSTKRYLLRTVVMHGLLRLMLEQGICAVFDAQGEKYRVTTNLGSFFRTVDAWSGRDAQLIKSYKVRAMMVLFEDAQSENISTLWERAVALTVAVRAYEWAAAAKGVATFAKVFGVAKMPGLIGREPKIKFAPDAEPGLKPRRAEWEQDTVVVGRPLQPGWDVMVCGRDGATCLIEAKLERLAKLVKVLAKKLELALVDRIPADLTGEAEAEAFRRLSYVLWVPGPLEGDEPTIRPSLKAVVKRLEERIAEAEKCLQKVRDGAQNTKDTSVDTLEEVVGGGEPDAEATLAAQLSARQRTLRYVKLVYDKKVVVTDKAEIMELVPPVLQPIEALMRKSKPTKPQP